MKLLVFAHTPPPHHGQSQMVAYLVDGFGGDVRASSTKPATSPHGIEVYHVNARLSDDLEDVGSARSGKIFLLLRYCAEALALRFRHGVRTLYYVPSPPKRSSLYRDWIVMALCRWFFRHRVFHWHSVGLGEWLEKTARPWERWISQRLLGDVTLSLALSHFNEADAQRLAPRRVAIVANGIPDPCPNWTPRPPRSAIPTSSQTDTPIVVRVLFLALCTRDKGVHDAVRGVVLANELAQARGLAWRFELKVAGTFVTPEERAEFDALSSPPAAASAVRYVGFLDRDGKVAALQETDLFCFPTYYANEGQPLNLIEAMAFGVPAVTTRWRAIPELFPDDYPGLIEPQQPSQVAEALLKLAGTRFGDTLRQRFLERFTIDRHLERLASVLKTVESGSRQPPATLEV